MEKIKVVICTGTTCYVMGNSQILAIQEELSDEVMSCVEISGCTCLKYCKDGSCGKAPFVVINDKVFAGATLPVVKSEIERIYESIKGD